MQFRRRHFCAKQKRISGRREENKKQRGSWSNLQCKFVACSKQVLWFHVLNEFTQTLNHHFQRMWIVMQRILCLIDFFYCSRVGRDISKSHFILFHLSLCRETFERKLISCTSNIFILTRDNRKLSLRMRVVALKTNKYLAVSSRSPKTFGAPWNIYREWTLCWDLYLLPSWRKSTIYIFITFATSIFENTISAIFTQFYHLLDDFTNHVKVYWSITATITLLFINARGLNSKSFGFKSKSDLCASVLLCKKTKKLIKKE